jgi:hypothetical protein
MPTVGWILDSANDRRTDAWPFNHEEKPDPVVCPLCRREFAERSALSSHLGIDHPLRLPMLRLGRQLGLARYTIRDDVTLRDCETLSCTECRVSTNGAAEQRLSPDIFGRHLVNSKNAHHRVLLRNERALDARYAESEVEVSVSIPSPALLNEIDEKFGKTLAVEHPGMANVDKFLQACPNDVSAQEYAGGLADYVIGVLLKEQDPKAGTVRPFAEFKGKLGSARHALSGFERPLARAVVSVIDFNLNHFSAPAPKYVPALRFAHSFFSAFTQVGGVPPVHPPSAAAKDLPPACPVDRVSSVILSALSEFPRFAGHEERIDGLPGLESFPLSEFDLAKINTLKAGAALLLGNREVAMHHLRRLADDSHFGSWANAQLERQSAHE